MSYSDPNWIARMLVGLEEARQVRDIHVTQKRYDSTAGPFQGGMSGAAMTWWTLTCLVFDDRLELYADDVKLGTLDPELRSDLVLEYFTPGSPSLTQVRLDAFVEEHTA